MTIADDDGDGTGSRTSRRDLIKAPAAMMAVAAAASAVGAARPRPLARPKTFVLVHGAWHGGWCYRDVATILRAHGHRVFTPTLTGLGDRSHLGHATINLDVHVLDIVNLFRWEELDDVILVGHSYGGIPITGAADRLADHVRALVYLDAFVPEKSGDSMINISAVPDLNWAIGRLNGDGWSIAPATPESMGVSAGHADRVRRLCVPHPVGSMTQGIRLTGKVAAITNRHYVAALGWGGPENRTPVRIFHDRYKADPRWKVHVMACGHDMMIDAPEETAALLLTV